jgi:hypothetical protein
MIIGVIKELAQSGRGNKGFVSYLLNRVISSLWPIAVMNNDSKVFRKCLGIQTLKQRNITPRCGHESKRGHGKPHTSFLQRSAVTNIIDVCTVVIIFITAALTAGPIMFSYRSS